jgi:cell division protein FtsW
MQLIAALTPLGVEVNGNKNWLDLKIFMFQPSELIKLGVALYMGSQLSRLKKITTFKEIFLPTGAVVFFAIGAVLAGEDLGTALVVLLIVLLGYFAADTSLSKLGIIFSFIGAGVVLFGVLLDKSRIAKILAAYTGCEGQERGICYQTIHGDYALAEGGIFGVGPGASREKWNYLPEAHNDFIFAIIGEELGMIATVLLLLAFFAILWSMFHIAFVSTDKFAKITTYCIMIWIFGEAMLNIGVVLGVAPVIGVPLPFISAGGTSLIVTLMAVGIVMSFARQLDEVKSAMGTRKSLGIFFKRYFGGKNV